MRYNSTKQNLQGWQLQSFLSSLPFWDARRGCVQWSRRETKTLKLQASDRRKSLVESGLLGWRRWRGAWHCSKPDSGANRSRENWSRTCTCVNAAQHGLELDLRDSIFLSKTRRWLRSISVPQALSPDKHKTKCNGQRMFLTTDLVYLSLYFIYSLFCLFTGCMCETSA